MYRSLSVLLLSTLYACGNGSTSSPGTTAAISTTASSTDTTTTASTADSTTTTTSATDTLSVTTTTTLDTSSTTTTASTTTTTTTQLTFNDIYTHILSPSCVQCHTSGFSSGDFHTYSGVSPYVTPGNSASSPLYEQVENNAMPQGGPALSDALKTQLKQWIDTGAAH